MQSLFGKGRHPNAEQLVASAIAEGARVRQAVVATNLGLPFAVYTGLASSFQCRLAERYVAFNRERGRPWNYAVPASDRAAIRTAVAVELSREEYGRAHVDDRELAGFVARSSRQRTKAVAGYDLTFTPVRTLRHHLDTFTCGVHGHLFVARTGKAGRPSPRRTR